MKNKKLIIFIILAIILFLTIVFFPSENNNILNNIIENQEAKEEQEKIEENQNFYTFLDTIKNINNLSSARMNSQIKFISVEDDTYKDLLTCSLIGSVKNTDEKFFCNGILGIDMDNINVDIKFPTYMKNLGTEDYSVLLEIPAAYKKVFSMKEEEIYLKIDKSSKEKLEETFKKLNKTYVQNTPEPTTPINKDKFKSSLNFTESLDDKNSGIYDIEFNKTALKALYKQIQKNEDYNKNLLISTFFKSLLKDEKNIENIHRMKGQIAVSKGVATDIYFEIESETTSMIAFRITLSEINNAATEDIELHSNEIKLFDTFIDSLAEQTPKTKSEDKTISIGNIYFTSADETKKVDIITEDMLSSPINVFINYSKCSIKTNLIVRWFYENQSIQLVENKLNNGEYEDGILKSSINFTNASNVPKGTYRVEIYIDGQDTCYGKGEFEVK